MIAQSTNRPGIRSTAEEAAFKELFFRYHQKVYLYFRKQTNSDTLSGELVQLTFVRIWQQFGSIGEGLPVSFLVFQIARVMLIDRLRTAALEREASKAIRQPAEKNMAGNADQQHGQQPAVKKPFPASPATNTQ